jgi:nitrite reductase (NAD(P)H)
VSYNAFRALLVLVAEQHIIFIFQSIPEVTIINRQAFPLSRQLDADAGEMVLRKIEALGVQVLTKCSPIKQLSRPSEDDPSEDVFAGFVLQDGTTFEADLVIYAIGIKPRDELAKSSGIECHFKGGIVIRDDLQTSAQDVYAIGECASWKGNTYGLIGPGGTLPRFKCPYSL